MTVKELKFDTQHIIEAHTALVDVTVATATAIELAEGSFLGKPRYAWSVLPRPSTTLSPGRAPSKRSSAIGDED
jgi:hypothetical protein